MNLTKNDSRVGMGLQDLRPDSLNDFVGQEELKEHLEIILGAARCEESPQIIYCLPDLPD